MSDEMTQQIVDAAHARQVPYPSPEIVVAKILGDQPLIPSAKARQRLAHKITTALRAAGWRILRA